MSLDEDPENIAMNRARASHEAALEDQARQDLQDEKGELDRQVWDTPELIEWGGKLRGVGG